MRAILPADIAAELESAIATSPLDRCLRMLWRTTDLLVAGRDRFREQEICVLDEVLFRLAERIEPSALARLSEALVDLKAAPRETLRHLVFHDDPAVAGPVLQKSRAIPLGDLEAIANSRGEQHLRAISLRSELSETLTDILLQRGGHDVCRALAKNHGARFSQSGYATLIAKAASDDEVTKSLALRPNTPDHILRELLSATPKRTTATSALPERVAAPARPPAQDPRTTQRHPTDYTEARSTVIALSRIGKLNDSTVNRFAIRNEAANLIASLSVLSDAPIEIIERVMADTDCEGLVMACRASRLNWQTTLTILNNRGLDRLSYDQRERAQQLFDTLYLSTSQWAVRWGDMTAAAGQTATGNNVAKSGAGR